MKAWCIDFLFFKINQIILLFFRKF